MKSEKWKVTVGATDPKKRLCAQRSRRWGWSAAPVHTSTTFRTLYSSLLWFFQHWEHIGTTSPAAHQKLCCPSVTSPPAWSADAISPCLFHQWRLSPISPSKTLKILSACCWYLKQFTSFTTLNKAPIPEEEEKWAGVWCCYHLASIEVSCSLVMSNVVFAPNKPFGIMTKKFTLYFARHSHSPTATSFRESSYARS